MAGAVAALGFWWWTGTRPPLGAPRASDADCVEIALWNNGYHTDLAFPAALLSDDHPLRRLDPGARYLLVGWGDEAFFRSDGTDMALGAKALLPGGPTTMNVVAGDVPVATFYRPKELIAFGVSRAGMDAIAARLTQTLVLDEAGAPQITAPGHGGARSWFLKARGEFDLFQLCNHWMARTLRTGGVDVNAAFTYTGDMLASAVKRSAHACPKPPESR